MLLQFLAVQTKNVKEVSNMGRLEQDLPYYQALLETKPDLRLTMKWKAWIYYLDLRSETVSETDGTIISVKIERRRLLNGKR